MSIHCKSCRFFVPGNILGVCRRYPEMQNKHEMDWCGEHCPVVTVKVYDIMTDTTVEKKRGRPRVKTAS